MHMSVEDPLFANPVTNEYIGRSCTCNDYNHKFKKAGADPGGVQRVPRNPPLKEPLSLEIL